MLNNHYPSRCVAPIFMLLLVAVASSGMAAEPSWRAGVARTKITPKGAYWMGGYASRKRPSEGTLQDLYAKAIAIEDDDGSRVVIVTTDLLVITRDLGEAVKRRVAEQHKLPHSRLLLNCSHTHCGPEIRLYRETLHNIPPDLARKMREYVKQLEDKLVQLVGAAIDNQAPARLSYSEGKAMFAVNRRNNRAADVPRLRSEGKLVGPVDHGVPVLKVTDAKGHVKAILFGYACHNTVMSFYQTSGDYAGFAQQYLQDTHPEAIAMFVMGAGGDQNPEPRRKVEYLHQYGQALADAVEAALNGQRREVTGSLRAALAEAPLEFQPHAAAEMLQTQTKSSNPYQRWKANFILSELDAGRRIPRQYGLPIQVIAFGDDLMMVAIGGECVVDYSLRTKRQYHRNGGPAIWVAGYSNDVFGYLPTLRVLKEGGYEGGGHMVYTKFPGPFTETVETRVFETIERLVQEVR
ncbi:MAG: neutral/alkaline non-lysosomal ceramidase N-terminal domain-containing protein [Pirellulaceae bacterium]|nr:neutral/alkaline non-lysosomal ceramidase N-terminal domain-containing protein [Pirellulaceae bacterium]MDP7301887.1 neutral/alkaline non-lysosomal ceramidase N-terminal domain-containing protein [Pirellulaceae bacterium]HJN08609.1 neutral/alkaline non-lysosomal ceramidase N-terminal domain-containing protein [Pirellulaceae bacterium]